MAWNYDPINPLKNRDNDKGVAIAEKLLVGLLMAGACAALFFFAAPAIIAPMVAYASIPVVGGAIAAAAPYVAYITVGVVTTVAGVVSNIGVKFASDRLGISEKGAIDKAARGALSKAQKEAKAEVRSAEKKAKENAKQIEKEDKQKEKTRLADVKAQDKQNKIDGIKLDGLKEQIDKNKDPSKDAKTFGGDKHKDANKYYSDKMAGVIKATVDQMGKDGNGDLSKLPAEQLAKLSKMIQDTETRAGGEEELSKSASAKGKLNEVQRKIDSALKTALSEGDQKTIDDFKKAGGESGAVKNTREVEAEAKAQQDAKNAEAKAAENKAVEEKIQKTMEKFSDPKARGEFISTNSDKIDYLDIIKEVYAKTNPDQNFGELPEEKRHQFATQNKEQIQDLATLKCTKLALKQEMAEQKATQQQADAKLAKEQEELQKTQKADTEKANRKAEGVTSLMSELGTDLKNLKVSEAKGSAKPTAAASTEIMTTDKFLGEGR